MGWQDVVGKIAGVAPMLGAILGGPLGGAAGTLVKTVASLLGCEATPEAIDATISANPEALLKLREFEGNNRIELEKIVLEHAKLDVEKQRLEVQQDMAALSEVNQTIRIEAASEHWAQWAWRPYWGFISGTTFFVVCSFVCYLCYEAIVEKDPTAVGMIPVIIGAFTTLFAVPGAILGITAWGRNQLKEAQVKKII
jgi:hypothetical protein